MNLKYILVCTSSRSKGTPRRWVCQARSLARLPPCLQCATISGAQSLASGLAIVTHDPFVFPAGANRSGLECTDKVQVRAKEIEVYAF